MKKIRLKPALMIAVIWLMLVACGVPTPTAVPSTPTISRTATAVPPAPTAVPSPTTAPTIAPTTSPLVAPTVAKLVSQPGLPLPTDKNEFFSASGNCAACHTNLKDASGADVSFDAQWRSNMHANAARDPYWLATVRSEVTANPALAAVIEDKCTACHMPMAHTSTVAKGKPGKVLDDGFNNAKNDLHGLASEAISCTLCHQITAANLGKKEGTSGGYGIDVGLAPGKRVVYTPFKPDEQGNTLMIGASGYGIAQAPHLSKPEYCATCHTLYTPFVDSQGKVGGELPEQMQLAEWQASGYAGKQTCQTCHMPAAQGAVKTSMLSTQPRVPFLQHIFAGGNAFMLRVLQANGKELEATASTELYDATIKQTTDQLQKKTATVEVAEAKISGTQLTANVVVRSLTGHKFPSGFPSRRAWLHVTVKDANGKVVFESGAFKDDGSIVGNENDADATKFEPHYSVIDSADKVQIYETQIKDTDGRLTTILLKGAAYAKDNRLLPVGFEKDKVGKDIAVIGEAGDDKDFIGGSDTVQYSVHVGNAGGPYTFTAELLYQSIGFRWAENLRQAKGDEIARFATYFRSVPNTPILAAAGTGKVDK